MENVFRRAVAQVLSARGVRLDTKLRRKIGREFGRVGLDGNGRFEKPGLGLAKIGEVLRDNGVEFDDIVSSHRLMADQGQVNVALAMSNTEDPLSPISITNSMLVMTWYKHSEYKYEIVAYLS